MPDISTLTALNALIETAPYSAEDRFRKTVCWRKTSNRSSDWKEKMMKYRHVKSPIGKLLLAGPDTQRVSLIAFPEGKAAVTPGPDWVESPRAFAAAVKQLKEYFAGKRRTFDLELEPDGTPFQCAVLDELRKIPYGETRSYGDIAASLGKPKAVRAVGAANGRNPLPIVIPCHRVIGANGSLTGFGGGIDAKRWLLSHEQSGHAEG